MDNVKNIQDYEKEIHSLSDLLSDLKKSLKEIKKNNEDSFNIKFLQSYKENIDKLSSILKNSTKELMKISDISKSTFSKSSKSIFKSIKQDMLSFLESGKIGEGLSKSGLLKSDKVNKLFKNGAISKGIINVVDSIKNETIGKDTLSFLESGKIGEGLSKSGLLKSDKVNKLFEKKGIAKTISFLDSTVTNMMSSSKKGTLQQDSLDSMANLLGGQKISSKVLQSGVIKNSALSSFVGSGIVGKIGSKILSGISDKVKKDSKKETSKTSQNLLQVENKETSKTAETLSKEMVPTKKESSKETSFPVSETNIPSLGKNIKKGITLVGNLTVNATGGNAKSIAAEIDKILTKQRNKLMKAGL